MKRTSDHSRDCYKWTLLGVLWLAYLFLHGTRQIFAATLPQIKKDFLSLGVTDAQLGSVFTVFFIVYACCLPFSGIAADLLRRKWVVVAGVVLFSCGTFMSSLAGGIGLFILSYGVVTSIGQSFVGASATSLISQHHVETRATAFAIYQSALYLGIIAFSALAGYLGGMGPGSWRVPFRVFGLAGLTIALLLVFILDDRNSSTDARARTKKRSFKDAATILFRRPSALLTAFSLVMFCYVGGAYNAWMPMHLSATYEGLSPASAAFNAVVWHFGGAFVGVAIGSRFSDRYAARRPSIRLETLAVGLVAATPFVLGTAYAPNFTFCCVSMALFGLFRGVYDSNLFAALFEVIPTCYHAAGAAIAFSFAFLLGSFSTTILGWMHGHLSSRLSLASLAVFYLIGAVALIVARTFYFRHDYERMNEQ